MGNDWAMFFQMMLMFIFMAMLFTMWFVIAVIAYYFRKVNRKIRQFTTAGNTIRRSYNIELIGKKNHF